MFKSQVSHLSGKSKVSCQSEKKNHVSSPIRAVDLYIPPAKLEDLQTSSINKSKVEYENLSMENLKKSITGNINKVNKSNIEIIIGELFKYNIVRGRGLLAHSIIQAQIASPSNTSIYAALVSVINSKFPQIGELIIKHLISSFHRTCVHNDQKSCLTTIKFLAHLVNQNILHEITALDILVLLLEHPYLNNDRVKLGIEFLKECGQKLSEVSPCGLDSVFSTLKNLLHESSLDQHTQSMIEILFTIRKHQFKAYPSIPTGLDLVNENDQYTHMTILDDQCEPEAMLDVFNFDEHYEKNERKYKQICKTILNETNDNKYELFGNSSNSDDEDDQKKNDINEEEQTFNDEEKKKEEIIIDQTETNLVTLRETIYLKIESSVNANECAHELLKINMRPGLEIEVCQMILDICAQKQAYERFFAFLSEICCSLNKEYMKSFEKLFRDQYKIAHRFKNSKLRNIAKFFAHLLATNAISWKILDCIRLTKNEITSSSRFFLKNLFFGLFEYIGLTKLNRRFNDPTLTVYFEGLFPHDTKENIDFTINFYTSIGLGQLADGLRKHVKRIC